MTMTAMPSAMSETGQRTPPVQSHVLGDEQHPTHGQQQDAEDDGPVTTPAVLRCRWLAEGVDWLLVPGSPGARRRGQDGGQEDVDDDHGHG